MGVRQICARVHRVEDENLIRGEGKYLDEMKFVNKNIGLNRALLEIYLRVPRFFGGGDKKALSIIKNINTISEDEGKKAMLHPFVIASATPRLFAINQKKIGGLFTILKLEMAQDIMTVDR